MFGDWVRVSFQSNGQMEGTRTEFTESISAAKERVAKWFKRVWPILKEAIRLEKTRYADEGNTV